ncbi:MAG: polysaccharide deacetylase [Candidatus Cloacimonadota bacterium]|nr:MAG: polysaccharide deacetylase [Candidatus Cloacimonadota bacterium]
MRFCPQIVFGIKTEEKVVALTFDDGPHPIFTIELLKLLAEFNVKATFFVSGKNIEQHKDLVKQIVDNGHELGNHAYSHRNLIFKTTSFIRNEIVKTDDLIKSCGADVPNIVRPPFGRFLLSALYVFCKLKKKVILWNIPTKDYKAKHPKLIVRKVYRKLKPGGIIVMHDAGKDNSKVDRSVSLQAVRSLLSELPQKGFRFVTISELLAVS